MTRSCSWSAAGPRRRAPTGVLEALAPPALGGDRAARLDPSHDRRGGRRAAACAPTSPADRTATTTGTPTNQTNQQLTHILGVLRRPQTALDRKTLRQSGLSVRVFCRSRRRHDRRRLGPARRDHPVGVKRGWCRRTRRQPRILPRCAGAFEHANVDAGAFRADPVGRPRRRLLRHGQQHRPGRRPQLSRGGAGVCRRLNR